MIEQQQLQPNRLGLKSIAALTVDAQFAQQHGTQIFNYQGEKNESYKTVCAQLTQTINDLEKDISDLKNHMAQTDENK